MCCFSRMWLKLSHVEQCHFVLGKCYIDIKTAKREGIIQVWQTNESDFLLRTVMMLKRHELEPHVSVWGRTKGTQCELELVSCGDKLLLCVPPSRGQHLQNSTHTFHCLFETFQRSTISTFSASVWNGLRCIVDRTKQKRECFRTVSFYMLNFDFTFYGSTTNRALSIKIWYNQEE